ncbi:universal stress protein [Parvularcula sp. ZS-1/3]|uniref:Universal stress protein n=1 Tax=Parvularcula mediterranea TaxID=2732508 RepID=A0A7Y3W6N2_9PROT|nr:universal stress protein [Parvularcula mediterranea]NNU17542.1 universal stress protein [Parvularcula mediterranea]
MALDFAFVPAIDEPSFEAGLTTALELVRHQKGHLSACHLQQHYPPNDIAFGYWQVGTLKALEADVRARKEKLEAAFYSFCSERGIEVIDTERLPNKNAVTASWRVEGANPFEDFGLFARSSDVSVLCRSATEPAPLAPVVWEDLVTSSGVPLLNVPVGAGFKEAQRILVGWNGSVEAKRAVAAAMPLLHAAKSVHLLSAGLTKDGRPSAEEMAAVLGRKGIKATAEDRDDKKEPDEQLVQTAADGSYDLLVIGAYSKPRWREAMFGGVTHRMLVDPPLPVLLVH